MVTTPATAQDTEAAGKWDSPKPQTNPISRHHHSGVVWSRPSQELDARYLHPGIFTGIPSIKLQTPAFLLKQGLNTSSNACKKLAKGREAETSLMTPRDLGCSFPQGHDYHRYQHCVQSGNPHARSIHMASSNTVLTPPSLRLAVTLAQYFRLPSC